MTNINTLDALFSPVKELLDSQKLLRAQNTAAASSQNWEYLATLDEAKHHAWHADEDLMEVWTDLREKQASCLPDLDGAYEYWSENYYDVLETHLASLGYEELASDVEADLFYCCINIHFNSANLLWDEMMAAYASGHWPCGWATSAYPAGNLVVFSTK